MVMGAEIEYADDFADEDSCPDCDGEGGYHDCGDDTCCCADPWDEDGWIVCDHCGGTGVA